MNSEKVYVIKSISTSNGPTFELKTSEPNSPIYKFDFINSYQFSLYSNNLKIIEAKSLTNNCDYSFKYANVDLTNNFRFYSKYKISAGYKLICKRSSISERVDWSWNYSAETSSYELINKMKRDMVIARVSGLSLDGQESGMLSIMKNIPEFYKLIIIFTACIILNRNLLSSWTSFTRLLNFNNDSI